MAMTVRVEVPDAIAREAQARGMDVAAYISQLLERAAERSPLPPPKQLTNDQFEAALDRLARFSQKIPILPLEAFSRESLYEDLE